MPDPYSFAKLLHILAVILMVGATVINGLIHGQAKTSTPHDASVLLNVVLLVNRLIMGPSLLLIPVSGYGLMTITGYGFTEKWLLVSVVFSILLIIAYLLGLRLERQLHRIATQSAAARDRTLPASYDRTFIRAMPFGFGALIMSVAALVMMIFKPF